MKNLLLLMFLLAFAVSSLAVDSYPKNPKIDVLNYSFRIALSDDTDEISCVTTVDVRYADEGVASLRLDLISPSASLNGKGMKVSQVVSDGKALVYAHEHDELLITLPKKSALDQRSTYTITYSGVPASGLKIANNKYGDRTFFSDNWPDKGRHWLATVDHPYDKATCEFIVTAPSKYQVVSNGLKVEETDLANGFRLTHWKQSVPIASWLYVLGVAKFAMQTVDEFNHKDIETWVYWQDQEKGFYDFAVPTKKVLEFYSDRVGPFAYEKLANIQSNSVSGGMEAASAILYSESSVVGDRNHRWRNVVIHEIAHQWFGNAVTEYDWDDVWLSEGFATYFTLLFIEHEYGHDAFMMGLADSKKSVDVFHKENPAYRIVHDNLKDMSQVTSSHTYQKGSWILHMLRGLMGEEAFWKGIRSYYKAHMNGNATTADFRVAMEEASGRDLKTFFDQWLYKPGALKLNGSWTYDSKTKEVKVTLEQVQTDGSFFNMPVQLAIYIPGNRSPFVKTVEVNEKKTVLNISVLSAPEKVLLDPDFLVLMDATFAGK
jgi:aminopeptidase N